GRGPMHRAWHGGISGGMNFTVRWYRPGGRLETEALIEAMLRAALPGVVPAA
nr:hypothetical protein [Pseudomonas sp.]